MKVQIKETGKIEEFEMIDPRNGVNYVHDFVGNTGAMDDGQFAYDEDQNLYVCSQETYDWWQPVIEAHEALEQRVYDLGKEHGANEVTEVINRAGSADLDDEPGLYNQALDEAFGADE